MKEEILSIVLKNIREEDKDIDTQGLCKNVFSDQEKQVWCPIIHLNVLNAYWETQTFKIESAKSIRATLLP